MSKLLEEIAAYAQTLKAPVEGTSAVGADLSYDPDFEQLKGEIDKLTSMSGEQPNWSEIAVMGEELLRERSKDMRLLAWCAVARLKTRGLKGFGEGLAMMTEVCREFWDPMFPPAKRARARGNLAGWLADQAAAYFAGNDVPPSERETLAAVEQLSRDLDALLSEKLKQDHPGLGGLLGALRDQLRRMPAEAPPAAAPQPAPQAAAAAPSAALPAAPATPVADAPAAAPAAAAAPAPQAPKVSGSADVLPALRALGKSICECAMHLRKEDPAQAWSYSLQRTGLWLAVKAPPPAEGGKTRIPPPQQPQVKKLESLAAGEQWMELLNTAEGMTSTYLFWFDLHRWVVLAMDRLGALFLESREAVVAQTLAFVAKFPALPELQFADGTPFADPATRSWLEEHQKQVGGGGGGGGSAQVDEEEQELQARFEQAKEMASSGKVVDALALGIQLAERGADLRSRFRSRLMVAQMALQGGKPDVARALLEGLLEVASEHVLQRWEPQLCAQLYSHLLMARRAAPAEDVQVSDRELFDVLCRLDPAAALKVAGR